MAQAVSPAPRKSLIANPVPVGVGGFALTTFTLGLYTSGHFNSQGEVLVFALAAFYGGLTQFVAGFFALARGDIFPAAFMTSYGAFWASFVALNLYVAPKAGPAAHQAVTVYLIMWTVITAIFFIASLWTNWVVVIAFAEFVVTAFFLIFGNNGNNAHLTHVGGYLEMVLATIAWYIVLGEIVNDTAEKAIFPFPNTPWHSAPTVSGEPS